MPRPVAEIHRIGGTLLGWTLWVGLTLIWGILLVPLTLLLQPLWPGVRERFASITRWTLHLYVSHLSFARFRLEGAEKRIQGPRVLVANHQSRLDSPVLLAFEPRVCGPVRGYMLRVPLVGAVIRLLGFFDADAAESAVVDSMHEAARQARARGGGLLFYPEGTRSRHGEIGVFRRGAFRVAVDHALPIQPIVLEGLDTVFPPGHVIPPVRGRHLVRIRYLEPLHPPYGEGPTREVVRGLAKEVRDAIAAGLTRMREERKRAAGKDP